MPIAPALFGPRVSSSLRAALNASDLPSFPTRRSSDLAGPARGGGRIRGAGHRGVPDHRGPGGEGPDREDDRSEEHTSELQSRRDLVCRLLLEKKKRYDDPARTYPQ